MRQFSLGIVSVGILVSFATGCSPIKGSITEVKVEETKVNDVGVVLDHVPATAFSISVNEDSVSTATAQAAPAAAEVSISRSGLALTKTAEAAVRPVVIPEGRVSKYLFVSNKDVKGILEQKMGVNFLKMSERYKSMVANGKSVDSDPQLRMDYKFKAVISDDLLSEYINFKLSDAFAGYGALIHLQGREVKTYWGKGIFSRAGSKASASADAGVVNLFELSEKVRVSKLTDSTFLGFESVSGGGLFALTFAGETFQVSPLASTLPVVDDTATIVSNRMSAELAAKLGVPQKAGVPVFVYGNQKLEVSRIYYLTPEYLFKEVKNQCTTFSALGYVGAFHCN